MNIEMNPRDIILRRWQPCHVASYVLSTQRYTRFLSSSLKTVLKKMVLLDAAGSLAQDRKCQEVFSNHRLPLKPTIEQMISVFDLLPEHIRHTWPKCEYTKDAYVRNYYDESFHPPSSVQDILTPQRWSAVLRRINQQQAEQPTSIRTLFDFLVQTKCGFDTPEEFWSLETKLGKQRAAKKPRSLEVVKDSKGVPIEKELGKLLGRLRTCLIPAVHAEAFVVGKTGLMTLIDLKEFEHNVDTTVVCLLLAADLSAKRMFTLSSAKRGNFSEEMHGFISLIKDSKFTNWTVLASLHPGFIDMFPSKEMAASLYKLCKDYMRTLSYILDSLWKSGVQERSKVGMIVARVGSKLNTSAWNAVADAWNNLLLFSRTCERILNIPMSATYKVLRLVAGDQASWAQSYASDEVKKNATDVEVFEEMTRIVLPWADPKESLELFKSLIIQTCVRLGCDPNSYLFSAKKTDTVGVEKYHGLSVCGIPVSDLLSKQLLEEAGAFGCKNWSG